MFLDWLADSIHHRRWLPALVLIALTAVATVGILRLDFDDVPRRVFKTADAEFRHLDELFADFGSDDNDCLVVVESPPGVDLFTPEGTEAIRRIAANAKQIETVVAVRSLADGLVFDGGLAPRPILPPVDAPPQRFAQARADALAHPLLRGQVISPDGRTALIVVSLSEQLRTIGQIDPAVGRIREAMQQGSQGSGCRARLTGVPPIRAEIFAAVRRESKKFIVIGAGLACVMGMILFRQLPATIIAAGAPILAAYWTLGFVGLSGEKLNVINNILPTLVMVVGFADSMHILIDIRHARSAGVAPRQAARDAVRHMFVTCLLTSSTTAVGFAALGLAELDIIRRFGLVCAMGSMLAFVSVMTFVPLLSTTWLGRNLGETDRRDFIAANFEHFERVIDWLMRHARPVTAIGTAVTLLFSCSLFFLVPDNRVVETIPRSNESYQALKHCDEAMGGSLAVFIQVDWPQNLSLASPQVLAALADAEAVLGRQREVSYPVSVRGLLQSLPGTGEDLSARVPLLALAPPDVVRRYVRVDRRRALVSGRVADVGSAVNQPVFARIESELPELARRYPGCQFRLTGTAVVASRNINKMIESLNQSLLGAAVVIFGSIAIGFGSLRLAAISVLPNIFPMAATGVVLLLMGQRLQITSVIVFSVCLGIAVDDTIHFLNRFRRELAIDGDVRASIRRAFLAVGSAVLSTTIVLLTGFGSVLTSQMPASRLFGSLSCIAYATAIVGDLVLLPALLVCFMPKRVAPRGGAAHASGDRSPDASPETATAT